MRLKSSIGHFKIFRCKVTDVTLKSNAMKPILLKI